VNSIDVMEISRSRGVDNIAHLGLPLAEAARLWARMQQAIVTAQKRDHAVWRPACSNRSGGCHGHDWRDHQGRDDVRRADGVAAASLRQPRSY
jgi:hypothetical protein